MYNRYGDIKKFITDANELKIVNGSEVYISSEENYDIVVDLDRRSDQFEKLKPFIVFAAENICRLDNIVQKFDRISYHTTGFPYDLAAVSLDEPDIIRLTYWGTRENTVFDVVFEQKDSEFILKSFGMQDDIPADWEKEGR